jgi:hypothetical protein
MRHEFGLITGGIADDRLGEAAAARLINVGEGKWQDAVDYIVVTFGQIFFQRLCKGKIGNALAGHILTQQVNVSGMRSAFCGEYIHFKTAGLQRICEFKDGAFSSSEGDICAFYYDGYFHVQSKIVT